MSMAEKISPMSKNSTETRIALLEQSISHIHETLVRLDIKIDNNFNKIESGVSDIEQKIDKINDRLWSNFLWLIGTMFTLATLCCGIMAKGFNWF